MSERLAWGSTEKTRTFLPCSANQNPVAAEKAVLPSPPLTPNNNLAKRICNIALAEHASLPCADLRHDVGQQPQAVVRRQDRHAQQVAHSDPDEQVLHARARSQRMPRPVVRGHAVNEPL